MKRLIMVAGTLALVGVPAIAAATASKHHHKRHHGYAAHMVTPPAQNDYGTAALHRIPSLDPPMCDSPNVVTVENCRISSNGRR